MNKIFLIALIVVAATSKRAYTLFNQCDNTWRNDQLGTSSKTICQAGCLISSVAMVLNTYGYKVDSQVTNPHTFNIWLRNHGGYVQGNLFVWASVNPLGLIFQDFCNGNQARFKFDAGYDVILNVRNGGHWVLMSGYQGDTFFVNDPGYAVDSYQLGDIVDAGYYWRNQRAYFENQVLQLSG